MMHPLDAQRAITKRVTVTRADVVAAKAHLLPLASEPISIREESEKWAEHVAGGKPGILMLDAADVDDQIAKIGRYLSARLAFFAAAWQLINAGVVLPSGQIASEEFQWEYGSSGQRAGFRWRDEMRAIYLERVWRPTWLDTTSEILEADLYLERLKPASLHPGVEQALRASLECFRRELWVPCVAMLGASSEGAWIETGLALAAHFSSDSQAAKLKATLNDPTKSTKAKIAATCHFYERPTCTSLYIVVRPDPSATD